MAMFWWRCFMSSLAYSTSGRIELWRSFEKHTDSWWTSKNSGYNLALNKSFGRGSHVWCKKRLVPLSPKDEVQQPFRTTLQSHQDFITISWQLKYSNQNEGCFRSFDNQERLHNHPGFEQTDKVRDCGRLADGNCQKIWGSLSIWEPESKTKLLNYLWHVRMRIFEDFWRLNIYLKKWIEVEVLTVFWKPKDEDLPETFQARYRLEEFKLVSKYSLFSGNPRMQSCQEFSGLDVDFEIWFQI